MLPHPARMCKHMRWGLMQRFLNATRRLLNRVVTPGADERRAARIAYSRT